LLYSRWDCVYNSTIARKEAPVLKRLLLLGFLCAVTVLLLGLMVRGGAPLPPPRARQAEVPHVSAAEGRDGIPARERLQLPGFAAFTPPAPARTAEPGDAGLWTSRLPHLEACYYAFYLSGCAG